MTTTPAGTTSDDILHIMAGTEPEYVRDLRAQVARLEAKLQQTNEVLVQWYATVEEMRKMMNNTRIEAEAVAAARGGMTSQSFGPYATYIDKWKVEHALTRPPEPR